MQALPPGRTTQTMRAVKHRNLFDSMAQRPASASSRRSFLLGLSAAATALYGIPSIASSDTGSQKPLAPTDTVPRNSLGIRALVFDVYGTCTDYWSTILAKGEAFNRAHGSAIDWASVATDWYGLFPNTFKEVVSGARAWQSPSLLRAEELSRVLQRHGVYTLGPRELADFNTLWNELLLWDDVLPVLNRLHREYPLATLSNADMSSMMALARRRTLPWDLILTSELVEKFKPNPEVYKLAPRFLNLKPEETLMVACHKADLMGAKSIGMRTAFVYRPQELGPNGHPDTGPDARFDLNIEDFFGLDKALHTM